MVAGGHAQRLEVGGVGRGPPRGAGGTGTATASPPTTKVRSWPRSAPASIRWVRVSTRLRPPDVTVRVTGGTGSGGRGVDRYRSLHARASGARAAVGWRRARPPLHRRAGRADRGGLAGPLGARGHLPRRQPHAARWPTGSTGSPTARSSTCSTCSRTPPGPGCTSATRSGYIGTDVFARYQRMAGRNVLHTMGYDAFGLPAEQYAVQTGTHPRVTTEANIAIIAAQLRRIGLAHDPRRAVSTIDPGVLPVDAVDLPADLRQLVRPRRRTGPGPIAELEAELDAGDREPAPGHQPVAARRGPTSTPSPAARWSTPTASPTWRRCRSTGARAWAPCWPTRRSPPTADRSGATSRCSAAR